METLWLCYFEVLLLNLPLLSIKKMQTTPPLQICEQSLFLSNLNIFLFSSSFGNSEASSFFIRACFLSWQAQNPGPGSCSVFHHWSPLLLSGHMALYSQHCHYFGGNMFHFECLQVQKVCVGLKLVVCQYEMGRTLLHPLHVLSPSLVEEQWQLQLGSGLSCWQKVLLNAREKRKCFICLALFSQLFWQLPKEKSLIFFLVMLFLMGAGGEKNKSSEDASQERGLKRSWVCKLPERGRFVL